MQENVGEVLNITIDAKNPMQQEGKQEEIKDKKEEKE